MLYWGFYPESYGIIARDIRAIEQDNNGDLWLGTYGAGLFKYSINQNQFTQYNYDRYDDNYIKCNIIYSLLFDEELNVLWIGGTQEGGLNQLNLSTNSITVFNEENGLLNNTIHAIEKDDKNRLWVSTHKGISSFDISNQTFTNYTIGDGVQGKEFSDGSGIYIKDQLLIGFGGGDGLTLFYPEKIQKSTFKPTAIISDFKLFNETVKVKRKRTSKSPLIKSITETDNTVLNYKQTVFSIGFVGLDYAHPEKIQYQYKLEGLDSDWNKKVNERSVTYRNLKPGKYVFKVKAYNKDGVENDKFDSLAFEVKPPWWRTIAAYIVYFVIVLSLIILLYRYNIKQVKTENNLKLEKELRNQENILHNERMRFFTNISHELRTPLMLLISPLEELLIKESPNTALGKKLNIIYKSAGRLLKLTNTLLEFRKAETGQQKLLASKGNISHYIEEQCLFFKDYSHRKKINIIFKSEVPKANIWFDFNKMGMIINNLLSNAIKNTPENKKVYVSIKNIGSNSILLTVTDEGKGIPQEKIEKIFDRFYQVRQSSKDTGTGIGLALTKSLVDIHHGTISVKSKIDKGSTFSISLPTGDKHLTNEQKVLEKPKNSEESLKSQLLNQKEIVDAQSKLKKITSIDEDKQKILVVEDNEDIRTYLVSLLNSNFNVIEAENGQVGFAKAKEHMPSLIISDLMMPKMNGFDLCTKIKETFETSHIPFIIITANAAHATHKESFELGADAYLPKPFKIDLLFTRIYSLLKSRNNLKKYYLKNYIDNSSEKEQNLTPDEKFLIQINQIIHTNIENSDFSVVQLASEIGVSKTLLYNKIKALTNLTPITIIRQTRLKMAGDLLLTNNYKVYEVMYKVSFNDEKYFRKIFTTFYGVSPTEYIKQNSSN